MGRKGWGGGVHLKSRANGQKVTTEGREGWGGGEGGMGRRGGRAGAEEFILRPELIWPKGDNVGKGGMGRREGRDGEQALGRGKEWMLSRGDCGRRGEKGFGPLCDVFGCVCLDDITTVLFVMCTINVSVAVPLMLV